MTDLPKYWIAIKHNEVTYSNNLGWIDYEKSRTTLSHKSPFALGYFTRCGLQPNYYWELAVL